MPTPLSNFWQSLPKPFLVMAPMADVTDEAFRQIIAKYSRHGELGGGPDVFFTEFVSADGLCSSGRNILLRDLAYSELEHPMVAQIFSSHPDHIFQAAELVRSLGFDGLDLNMGCPDKGIEKQGSGAAHIKDPQLAQEIIRVAQQGFAGPVSIKTRIGYNQETLDTWLPKLLETQPAAITIHARTRKEMSLVPACWEFIKKAVDMAQGSGTLIIGNGDVRDLDEAREKVQTTGADGIMLGRAIFGTPWLFDETRVISPSLYQRLEIMIEHTYLFEKLLSDIKDFSIMKKHFKAYVNGFDGAKGSSVNNLQDSPSASRNLSPFPQSKTAHRTYSTARNFFNQKDEILQKSEGESTGNYLRKSPKELRIELMATQKATEVETIVRKFLKMGQGN